jgi:hypothetical protein
MWVQALYCGLTGFGCENDLDLGDITCLEPDSETGGSLPLATCHLKAVCPNVFAALPNDLLYLTFIFPPLFSSMAKVRN